MFEPNLIKSANYFMITEARYKKLIFRNDDSGPLFAGGSRHSYRNVALEAGLQNCYKPQYIIIIWQTTISKKQSHTPKPLIT